MGRSIAAIVQYDGTDFAGFQRQTHGRTVQEVLEKAVARLVGHKVAIKAAGRTDAGVHARGQVIAFDTVSTIPAARLPEAALGFLPGDVVIRDAWEADPAFDPRRMAASKTYCYRIWREKTPPLFLARYVFWWPHPLDFRAMEDETKHIVGRHDFASFCAAGSSAKTTVREVYAAWWVARHVPEDKGEVWEFWIRANGFLYKMVRLIVGALLDIGRGKMATGAIRELLASPKGPGTWQCVPGKGLCLEEVTFSEGSGGPRILDCGVSRH